MTPVESDSESAALNRLWKRHGQLVFVLTLVWGAAAFLPLLFASSARTQLLGIPLSVWFMGELAPPIFVGIVWFYARRADALDAEYADSGS